MYGGGDDGGGGGGGGVGASVWGRPLPKAWTPRDKQNSILKDRDFDYLQLVIWTKLNYNII